MLLSSLLLTPLTGILSIIITSNIFNIKDTNYFKIIALIISLINLLISLIIFMCFDFSINQFQFIKEDYSVDSFNLFLGVDGLSIYFILLTTIIMPIALLSN